MKQTWQVDVLWVTVLFDVASAGACAWILWKLPLRNRGLLLPKQLVHLALADLLFSSMEGCASMTELFRADALESQSRIISLVLFAMLVGQWTSLMLEVHIAAGFLALFWRMPGLMQFLKRTVLLTWVIAWLPISVSLFLWAEGGRDTPSAAYYRTVICSITVVAFGTTSALYATAWWRSLWFPLREEQRAHKMVWLYPATFFITMFPTVLVSDRGFGYRFCAPFSALNGLLNVLVYYSHSRFSCATWRDMAEEQGPPLVQWAGVAALPVGFRIAPHEVTVAVDQRAALEQSEWDIVEIERARAAEQGTAT